MHVLFGMTSSRERAENVMDHCCFLSHSCYRNTHRGNERAYGHPRSTFCVLLQTDGNFQLTLVHWLLHGNTMVCTCINGVPTSQIPLLKNLCDPPNSMQACLWCFFLPPPSPHRTDKKSGRKTDDY